MSGRPATIVVGTDGMFNGHPTGTVDPGILPPGITEGVVIRVPPGIGWAIYINPGPDWGSSITWRDVPPDASGQMPFSIVVTERGDGGAETAAPGWFGSPTASPPNARASWVAASELVQARREFTATLLQDGKVLIAGGLRGDSPSGALSSAELYDPETVFWTAIADMSQTRWLHTATRLRDGRVLIVGGRGADGSVSATPEVYDPGTGSWEATRALVQARASHTATLLPNGKVLVVGGMGAQGRLAVAELFDPASGLWSLTGSLARDRSDHTATLLLDGRVLVVGGSRKADSTGGSELSSAEVYDPATASWTATGSMAGARAEHTATLLPDGSVLVAGGRIVTGGLDADGNGGFEVVALASAELYNPASGTWTTTGDMTDERSGATATLLADGRVLVAGGGGGFRPNAELYGSGTWTATTTMIHERDGHTATLLLNGLVLVAGGSDPGAGTTLVSAELYDAGDT